MKKMWYNLRIEQKTIGQEGKIYDLYCFAWFWMRRRWYCRGVDRKQKNDK
jgi:hypothetical protein